MNNNRFLNFSLVAVAGIALLGIGVALANPIKSTIDGLTGKSIGTVASHPEPGENVAVAPVQKKLCVGDGTYAGSPIEIGTLLEITGDGTTYFITKEQLTTAANGQALIFEGEQQVEGIHDIMVVVYADGTFGEAVGDDGLRVRDEGSFWSEKAVMAESCPVGFRSADDELMKLARDKRVNWESQQMLGNPIRVWLSTGIVIYEPSEEIPLTAAQQSYVDSADATRCDLSGPLEETPRGDPDGEASLGSSSCITVVIYPGEKAIYFTGARDGVTYKTGTDRAYLIPSDWSVERITTWVDNTFELTLEQYSK